MKVLLEKPKIYLIFQWMLGAKRARAECIKKYVHTMAGQRILDIGCGPGYVVEYFPQSEYVGFDTQEKYINYAKGKYGRWASFFCKELDEQTADTLKPFDYVIMNGLIHHLSDSQVTSLFKLAQRLLKPHGKLITLDGCYVKGQSGFAKRMLDNDRGKYVRDESSYVKLASVVFSRIISHIHHDWLRVPYTLIVMEIFKV